MSNPPAAWYPDPARRHELRYWDGIRWTEHVSDRGIVGRSSLPVGDDRSTSTRHAATSIATTHGSTHLFVDDEAIWWDGQRIPFHEITGLHWFVFLMRMSSGPTRVLSPVGHPGMPVYRIYLRRRSGTTRIEFQGTAALDTYRAAIEALENRVCGRLADDLLDRVAAGETVEVAGWELSLLGLRYGRRSAQWGERIELEPMSSDAGYTAVVVDGAKKRKVGKVRHFEDDGPVLPMLFTRGGERFAPRTVETSPAAGDPDWPLELVYSVGNEHSPASPTGRVVLTITGRAVRLDHHRFDGLHRRWTAFVDADHRHRLRQALATAGFPARRSIDVVVADATMRSLAVTGGSLSGIVELPFHETATMPGYHEGFTWLDTVVLLMTGGEVHDVAHGADPVVLTDIRSVEAEPAVPDAPWRGEAARAAAAAASDLGIVAVSPVVVELGDARIRVMAYFPQFGRRNGIFVFAPSSRPTHAELADLVDEGYAYSLVGLPIPYDRARMVRLLNDWAWVPTDQAPPAWHTGPSFDAEEWARRHHRPADTAVPIPRPGPGSVG